MHPTHNHQKKETMQIADGYVTTCPEMKHKMYGITPAEAILLKKMHNQYSNGTPLTGLVIVGEAKEVDQYGKPLEIANRRPFQRAKAVVEPDGTTAIVQVADFETFYTPSNKPRTQTEEINRLRRKYVGNVTENGKTVTAWEAAFGGGAVVHLPETFDEVAHVIGPVYTDGRPVTIANPEAVIGDTASNFPIEAVAQQPKRVGRPPKVQPQPEPITA